MIDRAIRGALARSKLLERWPAIHGEDGTVTPLDMPAANDGDRFEAALLAPQLLERVRQEDRRAVELHFGIESGIPLPLDQVGEILGIGREWARQRVMRALVRMRETLGAE